MIKKIVGVVSSVLFRQPFRLLQQWVRYLNWQFHLVQKKGRKQVSNGFTQIRFEDLPAVFINLRSRPERRLRMEDALTDLGLNNVTRFEGVVDVDPLAGCARSHASVLERVTLAAVPTIVIEDDVAFCASGDALAVVVEEFLRDDFLDVLCLGNVVTRPPSPYTTRLSLASDVQTTSCYVVKPAAASILQITFLRSPELLAAGKPRSAAALDILWKEDQVKRLVFAVPTEKLVFQSPGWSDIEGRFVDYRGAEFRFTRPGS